MKVSIAADKCGAAGQCAFLAPEVFDQREEDGVVILLDETPAAERHDAVREAAMVPGRGHPSVRVTNRVVIVISMQIAAGPVDRRLAVDQSRRSCAPGALICTGAVWGCRTHRRSTLQKDFYDQH